MIKSLIIRTCGECPYFHEGEVSYSGERLTNDSCMISRINVSRYMEPPVCCGIDNINKERS
jgi:hypothetical protein